MSTCKMAAGTEPARPATAATRLAGWPALLCPHQPLRCCAHGMPRRAWSRQQQQQHHHCLTCTSSHQDVQLARRRAQRRVGANARVSCVAASAKVEVPDGEGDERGDRHIPQRLAQRHACASCFSFCRQSSSPCRPRLQPSDVAFSPGIGTATAPTGRPQPPLPPRGRNSSLRPSLPKLFVVCPVMMVGWLDDDVAMCVWRWWWWDTCVWSVSRALSMHSDAQAWHARHQWLNWLNCLGRPLPGLASRAAST